MATERESGTIFGVLDCRTSARHLYDMNLPFLATREISAKPGAVMRRLHREGALVITDHGQPRALMLPVDESSFLDTAVDVLAGQALAQVRARSARTGTASMTPAQITALVKKSRKARRRAA